MSQKDVGNKIPIYKLKTTDEVMKYYDEWGDNDKYNKDMVDWNYTGPKETSEILNKHEKDKDIIIFDAGCGTGLVGLELKKYGFKNFHGSDLSQTLLDSIPNNLYQKFGDTLKRSYPNTDAWMISSNFDALKHIGLRPSKKIKLFNGKLETRLYYFPIYKGTKKIHRLKDKQTSSKAS